MFSRSSHFLPAKIGPTNSWRRQTCFLGAPTSSLPRSGQQTAESFLVLFVLFVLCVGSTGYNLCSSVLMFREHYASIELEFKRESASKILCTNTTGVNIAITFRVWFYHSASNFLLRGAGWLIPTIDNLSRVKRELHSSIKRFGFRRSLFHFQSYIKLVPLHFIPLRNQVSLCLFFMSQNVCDSHTTIATGSQYVLRYIWPLDSCKKHIVSSHDAGVNPRCRATASDAYRGFLDLGDVRSHSCLFTPQAKLEDLFWQTLHCIN